MGEEGYTGWDTYLKEQKEKQQEPWKKEIEDLWKAILYLNRRLIALEDYNIELKENLSYNQIGLPLAHGKRFVPGNLHTKRHFKPYK